MKDIFDMQYDLNSYTFSDRGLVDWSELMTDSLLQPSWIERFKNAFSAEYCELIRELMKPDKDLDIGAVKTEMIDMLHFLVSLSMLVGVEPEDVEYIRDYEMEPFRLENLDQFGPIIFLALDDLQSSLPWKWWKSGMGYQFARAGQAVVKLWAGMFLLFEMFAMDHNEVKSLYVKKNRINIERQKSGY